MVMGKYIFKLLFIKLKQLRIKVCTSMASIKHFTAPVRGLSRYKGKVAVITASTEGIGYATAERLASEGAAVVVSSRKEEKVNAAVEKLRMNDYQVEGVVCHVSREEDRKRLFDKAVKKFGGMDILISYAGVNPAFGPVTTLKTDEKMWDKIFEVNLKAAWLLAKEGAPLLRERQGGNILFMSSISAYHVLPAGLIGAYSVAKTAVLGLTKSVAAELVSDNIRVNCIAPGLIDTQFSATLTSTEESHRVLINDIPMKRPGKPEEVASVAAFLCSEDASYVTGETVLITGGQISRM